MAKRVVLELGSSTNFVYSLRQAQMRLPSLGSEILLFSCFCVL